MKRILQGLGAIVLLLLTPPLYRGLKWWSGYWNPPRNEGDDLFAWGVLIFAAILAFFRLLAAAEGAQQAKKGPTP